MPPSQRDNQPLEQQYDDPSSRSTNNDRYNGIFASVGPKNTLGEESEVRRQQQLECFAFHCRSFYRSTISLSASSHSGSAIGTETEESKKIVVAKNVLNAFDVCCVAVPSSTVTPSSQATDTISAAPSDQDISSAIQQCGLDDVKNFQSDPTLVVRYANVKTQQRAQVHEEQMKVRRETFYELLHEANTPNSTRPAEQILREFVRTYSQGVGTHSFLAGLRTVLEKQIHDNETNCCWSWTFHIGAISEHCYASQGVAYMKDTLRVLTRVFIRDSKDGETMISWRIQPTLSDADLRQCVRCLPKLQSLDARPTGSFELTSVAVERCVESCVESNSKDPIGDMCSLFQKARLQLLGCFKIK